MLDPLQHAALVQVGVGYDIFQRSHRRARNTILQQELEQLVGLKPAAELSDDLIDQVDVGGPRLHRFKSRIGQQILAQLPVLTLVKDGESYIEANFKETDLDEMRVGQPATIRFDAYPGMVLRGRVASIGAGTGSEFSVLPAQNATGNWVKVTQRVPVRIAIDGKSPRPLLAGLSTHVTVYTDEEN